MIPVDAATPASKVKISPDARAGYQPWQWNSPWAAGLLLFVVYVTTAAGIVLFVEHGVNSSLLSMSIAAPWLAVGVGVAGVLLGGPRLWPAVFAGSWVVWGVIVRDPPTSVTIDAAAEAGSILLTAQLLSVWGFHRSFDRFRDPLILLAAATLGRFIDVLLDLMGGFALAYLAPDSLAPFYRSIMTGPTGAFPSLTPEMISNSIHWAANSIAGIMLVVPLIQCEVGGPTELASPPSDISARTGPHVARMERRRADAPHAGGAAFADHSADAGGMGGRALRTAGGCIRHVDDVAGHDGRGRVCGWVRSRPVARSRT